jgi:NADH-quinone oxidoreductase subunit M
MMAVIRAVAQVQLARLLASITVALLAAVWWCLGTIGTAAPAAWYVPAVAIAASGLLLGAHLLDVRYGVRDVENLGGLARTMPRFAMLLGLLFMAAMGLPLFGVFSAFMTMVFVPSLSAPSLFLVLLVWFIASLFLLKVWHRVFYGPPRTDLLYHDLTLLESVPFIALVLLLLTAGPFSSVLTPQSGATTVATAKAAPP